MPVLFRQSETLHVQVTRVGILYVLGLNGMFLDSVPNACINGPLIAPALCHDDDLADSGRGLRLVEAYSLRWDYYRDGTRTVTWFECEAEPLV